MAAPESSPELSVVPENAPEKSDSAGAESQPVEAAAGDAASAPSAYTAPSSEQPAKTLRKGAPWWLVVVVAVVGLLLFLNQYQRAEVLDARVTSLTEELSVADQRLQVAQEHIAAHSAHLDRVRAGVASLSDQVAGLRALADQDPLNPAPVASPEPAPAAESAEAPASSESVSEAGETDADGYYWRAGEPEASAPAPALDDSEREAIARGALGTSFSNL